MIGQSDCCRYCQNANILAFSWEPIGGLCHYHRNTTIFLFFRDITRRKEAMDYDDMLEQVDALAVGMRDEEHAFVTILMETTAPIPQRDQAEVQRLYELYVKPYGYNQAPEGSDES